MGRGCPESLYQNTVPMNVVGALKRVPIAPRKVFVESESPNLYFEVSGYCATSTTRAVLKSAPQYVADEVTTSTQMPKGSEMS